MTSARSVKKKAITVRLDTELINTYQNFIRYHAGHPFYLTHAGFIAEAITRHMDELTKHLNKDKLVTKTVNNRLHPKDAVP